MICYDLGRVHWGGSKLRPDFGDRRAGGRDLKRMHHLKRIGAKFIFCTQNHNKALFLMFL